MPPLIPYGVPWFLFPLYWLNWLIRFIWKFLFWAPSRAVKNKYRKLKPVRRGSDVKKKRRKKSTSKTETVPGSETDLVKK